MERWLEGAALALLIGSLAAPMIARFYGKNRPALLLDCITRLGWGAGCIAMGVWGDHFAWEDWAINASEFPVPLPAGRMVFLLFGFFLTGTGLWLLLHPEKRRVPEDDGTPS